jgi:hypothetical protein
LTERSQQEFDLQELQKNWNAFGTTDPFWAILTWPDKQGNRWGPDGFFALGRAEIDMIMTHVTSLNLLLPRRKALDFAHSIGFSGRQRSLFCQGQLDPWFSVHTLSSTTQLSIK